MLVLLLFFLVCVWKALTNHTCFAVMCCPRATQCRELSGNPMPATPNSWRRCATAQSSTAHSKLCEKKTSNKHLPLPRGRSSDYRYHGVKRKMPSRLPSRLPLPRRQEARVASATRLPRLADRKSPPKALMMRTSAMRTRLMGTCVMSNMTALHL